MANTQITVPIFTTLEVLSSADQNLTAGTGCPVFATTVTRDAAFGGAGEKVLAEGQICYLESTNVVQLYDGANWQTVGPAAAASSGMTFISGGSVGTGTSFSLPNNSFTATYQNYLILWSQVGKSAGVDLNFRLRATGTDTTSNDYNFGCFTVSTSGTYGAVGGGANAAFWSFGECNNTSLGTTSGYSYIYGPQVADLTAYGSQTYTSGLAKYSAGRINLSNQYDSLTLFSAGGSVFNSGNYKLYGLADS